MTELLTAAQMRAVEQAAIESGEVTGLELMERAGRGVVEAVFEEWPELARTSHRAVVLCGPGNNGGDGFVVARLLKEWGWEVEVFLFGDPAKLPPDARVNYERWCNVARGVELSAFDGKLVESKVADTNVDLVVDALFGVGLSRSIAPVTYEADEGFVERVYVKKKPTVAVDIPSGFCADSGKNLGRAFCSALTVTFHRAKPAHFLDTCASLVGKVAVKDIGLDASNRRWSKVATQLVRFEGSFLQKRAIDHKYTHGHALILSGGSGKTGAARLAARGALRIGAGLVSLGVPPAAQQEVACQITALMLQRVANGDGLAELLEDTRFNALCIGPGLGLRDESPELIAQGLKSARPIVLDADALTLIGRDAALFAALHENCVLTPHGGEFARLFPDIAEKLNAPAAKGPAYSKVDATRDAARRAGCVVLFKGADTVIAGPDGRCSINSAEYERAAPWLATAGSGDVLSGFITGLLARGFDPMRATETAAWLHVECARSFGPGLIAEDLPEELPKVFRELGL